MPGPIDHLAVWVAAIVYYAFGALCFGALFEGVWTALLGKTMNAGPARHLEDQTAPLGISFAVFMGIALYATQTANSMLYAGQELLFWLIDTVYVVIGFAVVGAIVGGWRKRVSVPA